MSVPTRVVSKAEWDAARTALLAKEKQLARARDALAAQRRRLPVIDVRKEYRFEGPDGEASLLDLFQGRRQLIVDVDQWFGINVFLRVDDQIYRTYYTTARAAEELASIWALLDITPFGRQGTWQDAPAGVRQDRAGSWTRRSGKYTHSQLAGGRS